MNYQSGTIHNPDLPAALDFHTKPRPISRWSLRYRVLKKLFDIGFSILALPLIALTAFALLLLNPFFNPGPLFFRQLRMGIGGRKFTLLKFRTMSVSSRNVRAHDDPLEDERITKIGKYLRRTRIDEWPNFFNVLKGEMSIVGPRPDAWEHAIQDIQDIPHYRDRFRILPGITGLAQVRGGYADNPRATKRKARFDRFYLKHSRIKFDLYILAQTVVVIFTGFGAK
ncbi:MAG: sugar transferase [Paracoccaceae bacterium]